MKKKTETMTEAERQAASRAARAKNGLVRFEVFCRPEDKEKIRNYVSRLNRKIA